jgi:hypothetical protein
MWPDDKVFSFYDYSSEKWVKIVIEYLMSGKIWISQRRGCKLKQPNKIQKQKR